VVGDAGAAVNPFNGEGIAYAYETGRFAADAIDLALRTGDGTALRTYDDRLAAEYELYYKVARAFVRVIGNPQLLQALVSTGMRSRTLMEWVMRIMANMLRPDELGMGEAIYKSLTLLARTRPN
jgi:flavin-dependent dehydrogenase